MKQASLYACGSTDPEIESQICELRRYAKGHDYLVLEDCVFSDSGCGEDGLARPGLDRLRDRAAEGAFDAVFILSLDCLSGRYVHQILIIEDLSSHGVEVIFIDRSIGRTHEYQLLLQMQIMTADYGEAKIIDRVRRRLGKAISGQIGIQSDTPYGFRCIERAGDGEAHYEVVEAEAEIVREIFHLLIDGHYSPGQIAWLLTEKESPTRRGKIWDRSDVLKILKDPTYMGKIRFRETEVMKRKEFTNEIEMPPIVSREIFQAAQEELDLNRRLVQHSNYKYLHLLRDTTVCEQCGYVTYGRPGWFVSGVGRI